MDRITHICFQMSAVLFTVFGCMQFLSMNPTAPKVAHAAPAAPTTPQAPSIVPIITYQADFNEMFHVVNYNNGGWPEHQSIWCGVANIQAINAYAYWEYGGTNPDPTQEDVAALLNSSGAVSPWGHASPAGAFNADIAADGGTDPRAIAWALYTATPNGYFDHNYIYPGNNGVDNAVRNFASDFGSHGLTNPISVTVNGGEHSVVVSGIKANEDPSLYYNTAAIFDVLVWDPWYGVSSKWGNPKFYNTTNVYQWWTLSDWENDVQWWGQTYNTSNGFDPDPYTTPIPYYNVPPLPSHWNGNYITIEQDSIAPGTYDENTALDNLGNPVPFNCGGKVCSISSRRTEVSLNRR